MFALTENQKFMLKALAVHSDCAERGISIRDITNPADLNMKNLNVKELADFSGLHQVAVRGLIYSLENKGLIFAIKSKRGNRTRIVFTDAGYNLIKDYCFVICNFKFFNIDFIAFVNLVLLSTCYYNCVHIWHLPFSLKLATFRRDFHQLILPSIRGLFSLSYARQNVKKNIYYLMFFHTYCA